jgi:S1-C subfamily serine protease
VASVRTPTLAQDSPERLAERLTVRVRNVTCEGLATGSGFAVDPHVLVTNRHVLAGATELEVDTWDGHTLDVPSAAVGALGDLGVVVVDGTLPQVGEFGPQAKQGDVVTAVGYPLGGPLTLSDGVVVDRVPGAGFGIDGAVLRLTAKVQPGNSGGPLLDTRGRIVGVVFALEVKTGFGLAIPVDTLIDLARSGGLRDVPGC